VRARYFWLAVNPTFLDISYDCVLQPLMHIKSSDVGTNEEGSQGQYCEECLVDSGVDIAGLRARKL
jgi:hypothetical protein